MDWMGTPFYRIRVPELSLAFGIFPDVDDTLELQEMCGSCGGHLHASADSERNMPNLCVNGDCPVGRSRQVENPLAGEISTSLLAKVFNNRSKLGYVQSYLLACELNDLIHENLEAADGGSTLYFQPELSVQLPSLIQSYLNH